MHLPTSPVLRAVLALVATALGGAAVLGLVLSVVGYRDRAAVLDASFAAVAAEPGGIRLYGVSSGVDDGRAGGWNQCRAGHLEHVLRRHDDGVEVELTYHPSPRWGGCDQPESAGSDITTLVDPGVFVPLEGPAPATVTSSGEEHVVIDSRVGPDLRVSADQRVSPPTLWFHDRAVVRQSIDGDGASVLVWYAAALVGDSPAAWLASADLGGAERGLRTWRTEPTIGRELRLRVAGRDLRARLRGWSVDEMTYVRVTTPDGRVVLRAEVRGAERPDLVQALRRLAVRS